MANENIFEQQRKASLSEQLSGNDLALGLIGQQNKPKTAMFEIEVGRLYCRPIRDYLEMKKFLGFDISFIEGKGIIERTFTVKGKYDHVYHALKEIQAYAKED